MTPDIPIGGQSAPQVLVLGLAIGLALALACYLITNLSPGGLITPGWLALLLIQDPTRIFILATVTLITYVTMQFLRNVVILYGKRLFATVVLTATFLQATAGLFLIDVFPSLFASQTLGYIVPGLLAYQFVRQPPGPTLLAIMGTTGITYAIIMSGILLDLVPRS